MPERRIVLCRTSDRWSARFADAPQREWGGPSPRSALLELLEGSELAVGRYQLKVNGERSNLAGGHAEVVLISPEWTTCPECHGSGRTRWDDESGECCGNCEGTGAVRSELLGTAGS